MWSNTNQRKKSGLKLEKKQDQTSIYGANCKFWSPDASFISPSNLYGAIQTKIKKKSGLKLEKTRPNFIYGANCK